MEFMVAGVQMPSDGAWEPMENSPPGIHTMPLGAGPVGVILFRIVGSNVGAFVSAARAIMEAATKATIINLIKTFRNGRFIDQTRKYASNHFSY
jgi:hypothetical protein